MCEASAGCGVAGCVAWASVFGAIMVFVVEVPCVVCGDGLAAACAWLGLTGDEGLPVGAQCLVWCAVPAFGGGASVACGFALAGGALAFAWGCEVGASGAW